MIIILAQLHFQRCLTYTFLYQYCNLFTGYHTESTLWQLRFSPIFLAYILYSKRVVLQLLL